MVFQPVYYFILTYDLNITPAYYYLCGCNVCFQFSLSSLNAIVGRGSIFVPSCIPFCIHLPVYMGYYSMRHAIGVFRSFALLRINYDTSVVTNPCGATTPFHHLYYSFYSSCNYLAQSYMSVSRNVRGGDSSSLDL